jgi:hypothetical protein
VIRIINETSIILKCVEDHSGNWYRGLHKHFGVISHQHPHFPDWLGPLYFEDTSLVGYPLEVVRSPLERLRTPRPIENIKSGMLGKKVFPLFLMKPSPHCFLFAKGSMQNWKTRWFVLQPGKLLYCSKTDKVLPPSLSTTLGLILTLDNSKRGMSYHSQHHNRLQLHERCCLGRS